MALTANDIDLYEQWWVEKSRVNFLAYRQFMRNDRFTSGWFIADLCKHFQQFYLDLRAGLRPILLIQSPPQHGKSWTVSDFISWISGKWPEIRSIYATYSDTLGVRCNLSQQRQIDSEKYNKIFPGTRLNSKKGGAIRNLEHLEFLDSDGNITYGEFRNTTVKGRINGESLDLGIIDDAVKGREQANSIAWSQKIWEWFIDDFMTRFSESAGLLIIMTRWSTHDIIARLIKIKNRFKNGIKILNYQAIATKDETNRKEGDPLFPELKSLEFLNTEKAIRHQSSWESLLLLTRD